MKNLPSAHYHFEQISVGLTRFLADIVAIETATPPTDAEVPTISPRQLVIEVEKTFLTVKKCCEQWCAKQQD